MAKCRTCNKEMKFIKKYDDKNGFDIFKYECHNEDCNKQPNLEIHICQNCEDETWMWL